jgi:hypothetical protein
MPCFHFMLHSMPYASAERRACTTLVSLAARTAPGSGGGGGGGRGAGQETKQENNQGTQIVRPGHVDQSSANGMLYTTAYCKQLAVQSLAKAAGLETASPTKAVCGCCI